MAFAQWFAAFDTLPLLLLLFGFPLSCGVLKKKRQSESFRVLNLRLGLSRLCPLLLLLPLPLPQDKAFFKLIYKTTSETAQDNSYLFRYKFMASYESSRRPCWCCRRGGELESDLILFYVHWGNIWAPEVWFGLREGPRKRKRETKSGANQEKHTLGARLLVPEVPRRERENYREGRRKKPEKDKW